MALHYRTSGFVLKKNDLGEADRIFTIFTLDFGQIKVLGKAIRKLTSKLRGGIDIISLSEIEFIQGKSYKTLTDATTLEKFKNIKNNSTNLKISYKIARVLDNLIRSEEKDEKIWDLITGTFNNLNNCSLSFVHCSLLYYYFLWNFFSVIGYKPELYRCASCQKKLTEGLLYFSAEDGGIVCKKCAKDKKKINSDIVKILRIILQKDLSLLFRLKIKKTCWKMLKEISEYYYSFLLSVYSSKIGNKNI